MKSWQLRQAKVHFSEVMREVNQQGPQEITLYGEPVAIIISVAEYHKFTHKQESLVDFMQRSPLKGAKLKITRNR